MTKTLLILVLLLTILTTANRILLNQLAGQVLSFVKDTCAREDALLAQLKYEDHRVDLIELENSTKTTP